MKHENMEHCVASNQSLRNKKRMKINWISRSQTTHRLLSIT